MSNQDEINKQHTQSISDHAQVGVAVAGGVQGNITVNQSGDHHYYPSQPRPAIDPDQAQRLLDSLPLATIPDPAPLPPGSRVQLRRNPLFVGREADLKAIAEKLKSGGAAAITTGIGGVGKTLLAVEVAYCYGCYFAGGVFWLSFADPTGIDSEIAACGGAGAMELYSDATDLTQDERVAKVQAEWARDIPRLLIFDNCDDMPDTTAETLLAERLPRSGGCRVLVTSRRGHWRKDLGIQALPLGLLSRAESITLLRSHRADMSDADADAIAAELGDLPLALSLVGSYLEIYRDAAFGQPAAYLTNLRKQLLDHRSLNAQERSVRATFDLSYQRLDATDPTDALAIAALARAAHLAPGEPFPRDLLLATLGDDTADEETDAQRADALHRLVTLGLLEVAADGALRIHRLIALFAQGASRDDAAQAAVEQALADAGNRLVNTGYPTQVVPILPHLRHAISLADLRGDVLAGALAHALGRAEYMFVNYTAARLLYERALAIWEQALGPQHLDTASCLNNLAFLLESQGEYAAAKPLYERALHMTEQALGPAHPDTAQSLNNLAALLERQGEYVAAHLLFERALRIREQSLGPAHPDTAQSLNNLASLLESQGEYAAARPLYQRALDIREQALGPQHPNTASSLNNLASLLKSQGEYAAARLLYERALRIREQVLGPYHPLTASSVNNLASLLESQGEYAAVRPLFERALRIREQVLGLQHPLTASSLNNLAGLFFRQGEYAAARPLLERALHIREQSLGPQHPNTATCLNNLAGLFFRQGEYTAARPLYERALAIYEQSLGPQHPNTASSLNNLAGLLERQGEYAAARPLFERALSIFEQSLGPQHPDTAQCLNNLAGLLESQGEYAAARPLFERALAIYEQSLGPQHPTTTQCLNNLAGLLERQGEYAAARLLYGRALTMREQALGSEHPDTAQSLWWLGRVLAREGDRAGARDHLQRAAAIYRHTFGEQHQITQECLGQLAALDMPPQTPEQQIAEITAQAGSMVAAALADPTSDRAALMEQLEARARWAEDGEQEGSPYLALARHLRALATRLEVPTEAQQLAELLQRAQDATGQALAEGDVPARAALAERLSVTADAYAGGEKPSSPRYTLAMQLRALAAQLTAGESASD